jgi:hypothetical protein
MGGTYAVVTRKKVLLQLGGTHGYFAVVKLDGKTQQAGHF